MWDHASLAPEKPISLHSKSLALPWHFEVDFAELSSSARFFSRGITSSDPRNGPSQVLACGKQTISLSQDLKGLRCLTLLVPVEGDLRLHRKLGSEAVGYTERQDA